MQIICYYYFRIVLLIFKQLTFILRNFLIILPNKSNCKIQDYSSKKMQITKKLKQWNIIENYIYRLIYNVGNINMVRLLLQGQITTTNLLLESATIEDLNTYGRLLW